MIIQSLSFEVGRSINSPDYDMARNGREYCGQEPSGDGLADGGG